MGRKVILAIVCWLTISQALGDKGIGTQSAVVKDNASAESAPRLYRNVPLGVYASAAPYASYSFHLPRFIAAPKSAASQVAPVQQKPANQNVNTYLMDSYGNRFETSQLASYKNAFPQQYVSLQTKLPEHLAQPLVAASPNFQFKQSGPQVFFGAPFRVPALQSPAPTPLNHLPSFGQHLVYADKVQSLAPTSYGYNFALGAPSAQQQSSSSDAVFANTQSREQFGNNKYGEPKIQRQQESAQIIVGTPKFQNSQDTSHAQRGQVKFQRIQDLKNVPNDQTTFQHYQGRSYRPHAQEEVKFQRIQEIPHGETKFQRLQELPQVINVEHSYDETPKNQDNKYTHNAQQQASPAKHTTVTYVNDVNGKPTVVKVETDPVPLLDLTLLEPLTFENPLVPQVQHFLPRINQAVYQKLPEANIKAAKNYQEEYVVQKTMAYDSENQSQKPQKETKKKQKKPTQSNKHSKKIDSPKVTTVSHHETLDDAPEIVYEINLPGHKETIKEKVVSYNKQTQSEPVHYSYGSKSEKDPVSYSYSRTVKEPVQDVHYHTNGQGPAQLIYHFNPQEQKELHVHNSAPHSDSENKKESSHESEDEGPGYHHHHHTEHYREQPKSSEEQHEQHEPIHKDQLHNDRPNQENQHESLHAKPQNYNSTPRQHTGQHIDFEPMAKEFEEDIRLLTNAQIKVDPSQHVQHPKSTPQHHTPTERDEEQSHTPHRHPQHSYPQNHPNPSSGPENHHRYSAPTSASHNGPAMHIHEKSKRIIIHEEAPDERHMLSEQMKAQVVNHEENSEEDFEKAYKDSAIGFPAYNKEALEAAERDIFDPESYGVPPDHSEYDVENTPFQQYQGEGDYFPKETRANYKEARDKMKEDYYTGYAISKPESLVDRYQNKIDYYKLYKQQKPDYISNEHDHEKTKQEPKFAKYTTAPKFDYPSPKHEKSKSYYGHPKPKQQLYEYDYSKGAPRDNSAFASRPYQNYKSKTNFVEPQFQYGFEPISIPKLLDSELAAMATNDSPESEKPGMRKKVYKENWYIKKTSTSAGAPAS